MQVWLQMRVRPSLWSLLAMTVLLFPAIGVARTNVARADAYEERSEEFERAPWLPRGSYHFFVSFEESVESDGRTLRRLRFGGSEIGVLIGDRREGLWQTFDSAGVLRLEETWQHDRRRGPCRYYDSEGRLRVEGQWESGRDRVGLWALHDVIAPGTRWVWSP